MSPAHRASTPLIQSDLQQLLRVASALAVPTAGIFYALAAWRLAADLGWAGDFFVSSGPLSRWQIWVALAAGLQLAARSLSRAVPPARGQQ
jgi:hypothetical protein